ncbi:MAG: multicomponent Na+:H+ antiporter subunit [Tenuifilum sp.]|jgi:multicomponent Na+:H+ antiporter subunit F|uniref:monovalent cation/H+ antiporter complex subunit F n=1 Tax=Tenuifilum sp. TaxID=2760880 RepID=UPI0024AC484E|nr:monovalent cation/H+ antiporter complex subunit F [Tenuifilum sp.]MDI3526763.1 multicomponent Na+:H+ antiporter subunit [Tenuifilum sp.]
MVNIVLKISMILIGLSMLLVVIRFLRGPSLPDRVTAFDLFTTLVIASIAMFSLMWENVNFLDVAVVLSLIAFLGAMSFAYYIFKRKE